MMESMLLFVSASAVFLVSQYLMRRSWTLHTKFSGKLSALAAKFLGRLASVIISPTVMMSGAVVLGHLVILMFAVLTYTVVAFFWAIDKFWMGIQI